MLRHALLPALVWICLASAALAQALTFPSLSGRVVDEAGLLDASTRAGLTQTLADLEQKTTDQLVVVTLKSLQGTSIEDYGYQLGRAWQIGQKEKNNGVLLIVAPNERKVRIEVGYGLEGDLTDAVSRFIIENSILPRFKVLDFSGGIKRGVEDIIQVLSGDAPEWQDRAAQKFSPGNAVPPDQAVWPLIAVVLAAVAFLMFCAIWGGFVCRAILQYLIVAMASSGRGSSSEGSFGGGGSFSSGGSFSGGGGSFGGGGASGSW